MSLMSHPSTIEEDQEDIELSELIENVKMIKSHIFQDLPCDPVLENDAEIVRLKEKIAERQLTIQKNMHTKKERHEVKTEKRYEVIQSVSTTVSNTRSSGGYAPLLLAPEESSALRTLLESVGPQ